MEQIISITVFVIKSFIHLWPYLLVTIPLAVIINLSGASKYINKAFAGKPLLSVFLATCVGAFSPFCSCGVIPVISSLLTGGVPLAPVMSFWIASPSMDPEIFFLSSSILGWKLAIWRLASTFILSLMSGYITYFAVGRGFITGEVLRTADISFLGKKRNKQMIPVLSASENCLSFNAEISAKSETIQVPCNCSCGTSEVVAPRWKTVLAEILKATLLVTKFMGLAFLITALIEFYIPENFISMLTTGNRNGQVIIATLTGIPAYTSNLTALPMVAGLLDAGLDEGAALSFLIAGATTTLPAMAAVWGITRKKVFILYISYAIIGSLIAGLLYNLFN
jgi:hypothetical protein